jgi:hypothetical protein
MTIGTIKRYKTPEELASAMKKYEAAVKEKAQAGKAKIPITRAQGDRYDRSVAELKRAKKAVSAAEARHSRRRSKSKRGVNQK